MNNKITAGFLVVFLVLFTSLVSLQITNLFFPGNQSILGLTTGTSLPVYSTPTIAYKPTSTPVPWSTPTPAQKMLPCYAVYDTHSRYCRGVTPKPTACTGIEQLYEHFCYPNYFTTPTPTPAYRPTSTPTRAPTPTSNKPIINSISPNPATAGKRICLIGNNFMRADIGNTPPSQAYAVTGTNKTTGGGFYFGAFDSRTTGWSWELTQVCFNLPTNLTKAVYNFKICVLNQCSIPGYDATIIGQGSTSVSTPKPVIR